MYVFKHISRGRNITKAWLPDYNETHPNASLEDLPPMEYAISH